MTANAIRATTPSVSPEIASSSRRKNRDGASQPSCPASLRMPSVGSWRLKNGAANTAAIAAARPACVMSVRMRRPAGARATYQTTNRSSGSPAVTLTSAPSVSAATASISRRASTSANAPATASATSRSLCPLATDWNRTTGFIPNAATANAARVRPDPPRGGRDQRERPQAGHDRRHPEHLDLRPHGVHEPDHDGCEPREQRPVDGRRREPLRPDQAHDGVRRESDRRLDVRVRVMDPGDAAVRDVGVDVAGDEQRQRGDDDVGAHRQDHRGPQRDMAAPRLSHDEDERDRRRDDGHHRREHERGSVQVVQAQCVRRPAERPAGLDARRQHRM